MEKRGQITSFVAIAIILIVSILVIYFIISLITSVEPKPPYPVEFEGMKREVDNCLEDLGKEAINLIELQGGYVDPRDYCYSDHNNNVLVDARKCMEFGPLLIPSWFYEGRDSSPTIKEIEEDINNYVRKNLRTCTDNLSAFKRIYDITELGSISPDAKITQNKIIIDLIYPLEIKKKDSTVTQRWSEYLGEVETGFKQRYDVAQAILDKEIDEKFLEEITYDIIASSDLPTEGTIYSCGSSKKWLIRSEIVPYLQNLLQYNLHYLNFPDVGGRNNYEKESHEVYYENQYKIPLNLSKRQGNLRIETFFMPSDKNFYSLNSPLSLNTIQIDPSEGDLVKPIESDIPIVGSCIKMWHHLYTVNYQLLFRISDASTGDTFNLVVPVNLNKNQPWKYQSFYQNPLLFDTPVNNDEYCNSSQYKMDVAVFDSVTSTRLKEVDISYQCINFRCDIGTTDHPIISGIKMHSWKPELKGVFPECINGFIIGEKEGYLHFHSEDDQVTFGHDGQKPLHQMYLTPLKNMEYEFKVVELPSGDIRDLKNDEFVVLDIRAIDKEYASTAFYPINESEGIDYEDFELIYDDQDYALTAILTKIIETRDAEGNVKEDAKLLGAFDLREWEVTRQNMESFDKIRFYLITSDTEPRTNDDIAALWENEIAPKAINYLPQFTNDGIN
ncbi:hypothetical protein ACFL1H_01695 [Nanoarchaeota archaeon]